LRIRVVAVWVVERVNLELLFIVLTYDRAVRFVVFVPKLFGIIIKINKCYLDTQSSRWRKI